MKLGQVYLSLYNALQFIGWFWVLISALPGVLHDGQKLWIAFGSKLYFFQMLMLIDVVNAALGLVRSPITTAVMQVASRIFVINILEYFGESRSTIGLHFLLFAWTPTEIIRYSFYLVKDTFSDIPYFLKWLRYSTFLILYPLGISGEIIVLYASKSSVKESFQILYYFIILLFIVYPFGAFVLYRYMLNQRKKSLNELPSKDK